MTQRKRGFAAMDPEQRKAIAAQGGRAVPPEARSFAKNPGLAASAGRKGGQAVRPENRSFSQDKALASEAGRKGGQAAHKDAARGKK